MFDSFLLTPLVTKFDQTKFNKTKWRKSLPCSHTSGINYVHHLATTWTKPDSWKVFLFTDSLLHSSPQLSPDQKRLSPSGISQRTGQRIVQILKKNQKKTTAEMICYNWTGHLIFSLPTPACYTDLSKQVLRTYAQWKHRDFKARSNHTTHILPYLNAVIFILSPFPLQAKKHDCKPRQWYITKNDAIK